MTREELKKIARCYAHDELKDNHGDVEDIVASAFIDGAKWADETMINKVCEWLKNYAHMFVSETTGDLDEDDLINAFRKAMKGD